MKRIFGTCMLAVLLAVFPSPSWALRSIGIVTKEQAKAMGLEVRATKSGPQGVYVEVEFETKDQLKGFNPEVGSLVELRLDEKDKPMVTASLQLKHLGAGHYSVSFSADRTQMEKITVTIVVGQGAMAGGASEVHMKDFVDLEKVR